MLMSIGLILLSITMMVYFANHWYALTLRIREDASATRMHKAVDWKHPAPTGRNR